MRTQNFRRQLGVVVIVLSVALLGGCTLLEDDGDSNSAPGGLGAGAGADDSSNSVCGFDVLPSPSNVSTNPCEEGETILSESIERSTGKPEISTRTIEMDGAGELCVKLHDGSDERETENGGNNGRDGAGGENRSDRNRNRSAESGDAGANKVARGMEDRVTAAWLYVDGEEVAGPNDFAAHVGSLQKTLEVDEGEHEVEVRIASKPESSVDLEIRAVEGEPSEHTTEGEKGILEVKNVAVDHPLFSPNGDGYHDTVEFNADNEMTRLPGDGRFDYRLDWDWTIVAADSCTKIDAGASGSKQVNSPTNVRYKWDGTTATGSVASDGNYIYRYHAELVRSDGLVVDEAVAHARGFVLDTSKPDYDPNIAADRCDPDVDPYDCECPDDTEEGTRCSFAWIPYLETFEDAGAVDTSAFLTAHEDDQTGRWEVAVDLRNYNGGGLIPQKNGEWESIEDLQQYVSTLTGVPVDPDAKRLFNFDYTQLGYSRPVVRHEGVRAGFNHFLLDVITDADGRITIDGHTIDLKSALASDTGAVPDEFKISNPRLGEECGYNGNTDGETDVRASSCTELRTANLDPGGTDLGIYIVQRQVFGFEVDGAGTVVDEVCIVNGIAKCGVRSLQRNADITFESRQYAETDEILEVRDVESLGESIPSLVGHTDRHFEFDDSTTTPIDGICASDTATRDAVSIPLDSGAGALPPVCIVNGIL